MPKRQETTRSWPRVSGHYSGVSRRRSQKGRGHEWALAPVLQTRGIVRGVPLPRTPGGAPPPRTFLTVLFNASPQSVPNVVWVPACTGRRLGGSCHTGKLFKPVEGPWNGRGPDRGTSLRAGSALLRLVTFEDAAPDELHPCQRSVARRRAVPKVGRLLRRRGLAGGAVVHIGRLLTRAITAC